MSTLDLDSEKSVDLPSNSSSHPREKLGAGELEAMKVPDVIIPDSEIDFPDGGIQAWLVVFGAFCSAFSTFGYVNAFGAFQAYYEQTLLPDVSPANISLVMSVQDFLTCLICLFSGRLFDIGIFHLPLFISSCLIILGTLALGQCHAFWQVMLCQGIVIGLGCGGMFGPTLAVVSHWFKKRRSTALGLVVSGMSVGGAVLSILIDRCIVKVGFPWTMRITAFLFVITSACVNLLMKRRLPPVKTPGGFFNWKAFKFPPFSCYVASTFLCFLGIFTVLINIEVSASKAGIPESFDVYFLAIANGTAIFGRILMGMLADRIGCLTVMIPWTIVTAATTFAWPFAKSLPSLLVIASLYGLGSGTFLGLVSIPLIHMGDTADVGRRAGTSYTAVSFAVLAGTPISGAIIHRTGSYELAGVYAGVMISVSVVLMWYSRYLMTGAIFKGKF